MAPTLASYKPHLQLAPDETVILLAPPLPSVGVSIGMERGCQQNDSLVRGYLQQPILELVRVDRFLRGRQRCGECPACTTEFSNRAGE